MKWQRSFWFRDPLTQHSAGHGEATINSAATVLAMLLSCARYMGGVCTRHNICAFQCTRCLETPFISQSMRNRVKFVLIWTPVPFRFFYVRKY